MPTSTVTQRMPCPAAVVFDLIHDYPRRLEWDTLLSEARLTRGHRQAERGATSLCVGKGVLKVIGIETEYLVFRPGVLAAVKMINRPPFFASFSASIRHQEQGAGSLVTYRLHFTARPAWLRWILHPVMRPLLRYETKKRLQALAVYLDR